MTLIRDAIYKELERRDKSPYWLAQQLSVSESSFYRSMKSGRFRTDLAEECFEVLKLTIVPRGQLRKLKQVANAAVTNGQT